jgi:hypothetical protein
MNSLLSILIEALLVSIAVGSIVAAIAIWRGWIPNFFIDKE